MRVLHVAQKHLAMRLVISKFALLDTGAWVHIGATDTPHRTMVVPLRVRMPFPHRTATWPQQSGVLPQRLRGFFFMASRFSVGRVDDLALRGRSRDSPFQRWGVVFGA